MNEVPEVTPAVTGHERRKQRRHIVRWDLELRRRQPGGLMTYHGQTADVSIGGVRAYADCNIPAGEIVYLRLAVQHHGGNTRVFDLEAIARVMHISYSSLAQNFEIGLLFTEFKNDGKKQLADVIAHFEKELSTMDITVLHGL